MNTTQKKYTEESIRFKKWLRKEFEYKIENNELYGATAINKIRNHIKRNCKYIKIISCDDFCASGSLLVLIPDSHSVDFLFVPQNYGRNIFSLYKDECGELIKVINKLTKNLKTIE
jgi:hypothetical protein